MSLRKNIVSKFMRLRSAITKSTIYRIQEDTTLEEKIQLLRKDIYNAPSHVFGEHNLCKSINYFKCGGQDTNSVPIMKDCGIYEDVMAALQRVIDNASSLIMNMDNNLTEYYNSVVCKFVGGKRINFSLRGAYQSRCEAAALSFNSSGEYHRIINKAVFGHSPKGFYKKFYLNKIKQKLKTKVKKNLFPQKRKISKQSLPDQDYGPNAHYIPLDLSSQEYKDKAQAFVSSLSKSVEEIKNLERNTLGQKSNPQWIQERLMRLTASNVGQICKMRATTSPVNLIKNLLYGNFFGNKATRYGNENEAKASAEFETLYNLNVHQSGFHIDKNIHFWGQVRMV